MKSKIISIAFCALLAISFLTATSQVAAIHFTVRVPITNDNNKGVYIGGSFNYWHAGDSLYKMNKIGEGLYSLTIPVFGAKKYGYKYTLGSWDRVEINTNDSDITNRYIISANEKNISDTVLKWKQPKPAENKNPQLEKLNAMKDSVLTKLKPELNNMLDLLKSYVKNFLQDKPSIKLHRRLDKKAVKKLGSAYKEITKLLWNAISLLTPEQKSLMRKQINGPGSKEDFLNTFLKSFNTAIEGNK